MPINNEIRDIDTKTLFQMLRSDDTIEVYTDGSCLGNPGPGGWGAIFIYRSYRATMSGTENPTTNNRMEIMAAIKSIEALPEKVKIILYTDSMYLKNGITMWIKNWKENGWKSTSKKPVKNKDLWEMLDKVIESKSIEWSWVKGHGMCQNNNNADFVARSAIVGAYMNDEESK